ncbi:MAG: arylsulfatase [Planctomycetes bacterium]|nr:arylsulfatase [Planctomycetota bacterium]
MPGPPPRPPNVVILYADDLGYGDLGCYQRQSKIPTPHLDRLAAEGLRFTDAHSSSGICTPSRYALLTGRHHWRKFHRIVPAFGSSVFEAERLTMPEMFRAHGYRTACIGKWHLGWDWAAIRRPGAEPTKGEGYAADAFDWRAPVPDGPLAHGFDHYFGDDVPNFPPYAWIEDDRVVGEPSVRYRPSPRPPEGNHEGRPGPMVDGWRLDAVMPELTRRAVAWLRDREGDDAPFFLYFPFTSPHAPIVPAAEWVGRSGAGPYGDFVAQTDDTVGAVLRALDQAGLADDTIVVFSADNGPEHYAYPRVERYGHRSTGELRGLKRDVFEGGHRVPMIVRWPGAVAPGTVSAALVSQCDLMATFAAMLGHRLPDDAAEDSFDQTEVLRGHRANVRDFAIHNTFASKWGVRRGRWLLLTQNDGYHTRVPQWVREAFPRAEGDVMLCDLEADLGQSRDVSDRHPDVVAELRVLLDEVRRRGHSAPRLSAR